MPYPSLGLTLSGEDAIAFDERMKNPPNDPIRIAFLKEAADLHRRGVV